MCRKGVRQRYLVRAGKCQAITLASYRSILTSSSVIFLSNSRMSFFMLSIAFLFSFACFKLVLNICHQSLKFNHPALSERKKAYLNLLSRLLYFSFNRFKVSLVESSLLGITILSQDAKKLIKMNKILFLRRSSPPLRRVAC